jgi:hypothetical protein
MWHDLMKIDESAEDIALRAELQNMLGIPEVQHPQIKPNQDTIALAKLLYREAMRRRRTAAKVVPMHKRPLFILIAAAIPVAFSITALGTWGVRQKRRADVLAAKTKELEIRQNRLDAAREGGRNREQLPPNALETDIKPTPPEAGSNRTPPNNDGELIKPEERPRQLSNRPEQHRVNNRR